MSEAERVELTEEIKGHLNRLIGRWVLVIVPGLAAGAFLAGMNWSAMQTTLRHHDSRLATLEERTETILDWVRRVGP